MAQCISQTSDAMLLAYHEKRTSIQNRIANKTYTIKDADIEEMLALPTHVRDMDGNMCLIHKSTKYDRYLPILLQEHIIPELANIIINYLVISPGDTVFVCLPKLPKKTGSNKIINSKSNEFWCPATVMFVTDNDELIVYVPIYHDKYTCSFISESSPWVKLYIDTSHAKLDTLDVATNQQKHKEKMHTDIEYRHFGGRRPLSIHSYAVQHLFNTYPPWKLYECTNGNGSTVPTRITEIDITYDKGVDGIWFDKLNGKMITADHSAIVYFTDGDHFHSKVVQRYHLREINEWTNDMIIFIIQKNANPVYFLLGY
jgi:hypothetical protein